jgi:hypothetical protein
MVKVAHAHLQQDDTVGVLVVFDAPPEQIGFHRQDLGIDATQLPHVQLRDAGLRTGQVDSLLRASIAELLVYGERSGAPAEQVARMRHHFPHLVRRIDVAEGQVLVLSRKPQRIISADHRSLTRACPDRALLPAWEIHEDLATKQDDGTGMHYWDYGGREFGLLVSVDLDTAARMAHDRFEVAAELYLPEGPVNAGLVVELKDGDSTVFYRTAELMDLAWQGLGDRATLVVAAHPADARLRERSTHLLAYLYNREGAPLGVVNMSVVQRFGNPVELGITAPIEGPWQYRP